MSTYHDPVRHLEYLRQSLSQNKKPIGFFISAGCPLSVQMPKDKWPLIPDVKNLTLWLNEKMKGNSHYDLLLCELLKAGKNNTNIEDILSFLRGLLHVSKGGNVRGLCEKDLRELEIEISKKISEKLDVELPSDKSSYHNLVKWIGSIDRDVPIEIFTTNYDLLIEQALESLEIPYFDGFVGARRSFFDLRAVEGNLAPKHWTRVWKIHGSINWYQEEIKGQKKIFRASEINDNATPLILPSHLKYDQSRKMPYLALIDQLGSFIKQKSSLLIISGYSFNDEHLNDIIINSLKANPSAMALALMFDSFSYENEKKEVGQRYSEAYKLAANRHNLNIWTFDKAIIGTNLANWKSNNIIENKELEIFIENKPKNGAGSELETNIKLGDFNVFGNFLKTLIGSERD